jgi:DNA transformation protein
MTVDMGLVEWVTEALEPIGAVSIRRMMGGATLYCDGTLFALTDDGELFFKADAESLPEWDAAGCRPFTYPGRDGEMQMTKYRRAPADVYDDADAMRSWARVAIAAGARAAEAKKPKLRKARQV